MRPALIASAALAATLVAGAAQAQAVPTAAGREGEISTAQQIDQWVKSAPPVAAAAGAQRAPLVVSSSDASSPWADEEDGRATFTRRVIGTPLPYDASPLARTLADGQLHGEVGAEVGTGGYGGYGVVSGKVAKDVYVQLGVSDYESNGRGRRYRGSAYGGGYGGYGAGYGGYAPGGYGSGGYAAPSGRSLSLSAAWLPGHDAPDEPWRRPTVSTPAN